MRIFSPKNALVVVSGVAFAILLLVGYWFLPLTPPNRVTLEIRTGMSLSQVAHDLEREGVRPRAPSSSSCLRILLKRVVRLMPRS